MNQGLTDRTVRLVDEWPLTFEELEAIRRDVARGARHFWRQRGLPEPGESWADKINADARVGMARRAAMEGEL